MVVIGLLSGLIPLLVFIVSWLFGISTTFLTLTGYATAICIFVYIFRKIKVSSYNKLPKQFIQTPKLDKLIIILIGAFAAVNLIGVIVPETGFDALWYHLTIPKIFLTQGIIDFIPGSLYYYSAMPKLVEIWYMVALSFDTSGALAKLIHYFYGIACLLLLYQFSRKIIGNRYAIMAVLGLISSLLFCWESGSAYIDLAWTFYTLLALYIFNEYREKPVFVTVLLSGVASGLAIGTKLPAIIPAILLFVIILRKSIKHSLIYSCTVLIVSFPWFYFSFIKTGNPVYPFMNNIYPHENIIIGVKIFNIINSIWHNLTWPQDPFSIFIGFLPVVIIFAAVKNIGANKGGNPNKTKWLWAYFILNYIAWYLLFRSSGSRFLLYLLPIWLIICLASWSQLNKHYYNILYGVLILSSFVNLTYRIFSVSRTLPVILGKESRQDYLLSRLNFNYGDFYDRDNNIRNIVGDTPVLVFGFHNLFYTNFKFIDASQTSNYEEYKYWLSDRPINGLCPCKIIYSDEQTKVNLYSL